MVNKGSGNGREDRIAALEERSRRERWRSDPRGTTPRVGSDDPAPRRPRRASPTATAAVSVSTAAERLARVSSTRAPSSRSARPADAHARGRAERDLEDFVGGSVLAWLGGVAVLAGLAFLLTIAVSRGWIGEGARTALAGALSPGCSAPGVWLRERSASTEAALAAAAVGIAGLFGTLVVAGPVYHLVPAALALPARSPSAPPPPALAIRWRAQVMGWLGLLGALLAPTALGAYDGGGMVFLASPSPRPSPCSSRSAGRRSASFAYARHDESQWLAWVDARARRPRRHADRLRRAHRRARARARVQPPRRAPVEIGPRRACSPTSRRRPARPQRPLLAAAAGASSTARPWLVGLAARPHRARPRRHPRRRASPASSR